MVCVREIFYHPNSTGLWQQLGFYKHDQNSGRIVVVVVVAAEVVVVQIGIGVVRFLGSCGVELEYGKRVALLESQTVNGEM